MEQNIARLVHLIKRRKPEALEKVMDLYMSSVYHVAVRILHNAASKEDIEECIQDTFLDAWNLIDKYDPERGSFKTWLLILCKYRALSIRRTLMNQPEVIEFEELTYSMNENPESELLIKEGTKDIITAIDILSPIDREIFLRRFILEQGIDDICKTMKLSRKSIDNRLWRGRNRLKATLSTDRLEDNSEQG